MPGITSAMVPVILAHSSSIFAGKNEKHTYP
jgi:hypothetical protein